jgi:hypothetical protein
MWFSPKNENSVVKINTDFIALLYPDDKMVVLSSGNELVLSDEDYEDLHNAMFPTRKKVAKDDTKLAEFLNKLHRLTGGKNDAILTPQRKKKLTDLIRAMTPPGTNDMQVAVEKITLAATNIGKDKWLQGENENNKRYGDIDFLLRPDKCARYAELSPADKRKKMF